MALTTVSTTLLADEVTATVATAVVQDPLTGRYVREFRFFGTIPDEGVAGGPPLLLTVRAEALEDGALRITTPSLSV